MEITQKKITKQLTTKIIGEKNGSKHLLLALNKYDQHCLLGLQTCVLLYKPFGLAAVYS